MRKLILLTAAVLVLGSGSMSRVQASQEYDDYDSHPLVLLSYALNPIGYTIEWLVTRPIHELVRQPDLGPVFGHDREANYGEESIGVVIHREGN